MELEVTWTRAIKVWWSFLWRNILAVIGAVVIGAITGGILGFVLGMLGASLQTIQLLVTPIGFIIGIGISIIPLKLILGKDFGEFRLVLVENSDQKNV